MDSDPTEGRRPAWNPAWSGPARWAQPATIDLFSALALHELTDEIPRATDIALPRGERTLKTRFAPIRWHSFDRDTFHLGRGTRELPGDIEIGLYGQERTIIDAFRMRHELGTDIAHEALKRWLRRQGSNPGELLTMANHFPKASPALVFRGF